MTLPETAEYKGIYRIAGINIEIRSLYPGVQELCKEYRAQGEPDICVQTSASDIDIERQKSISGSIFEGREPKEYPPAYLEELAVYRRICEQMPIYDTVLFHGSAVAVDGQAYLFTAKSGTGKSTHVSLWKKLLGDRAVIINDDKPLIRISPDGAIVFGTPWDGKHRRSANTSAPLKAICFLERAEQNSIVKTDPKEALPGILRQIYRPADSAAMAASLRLADTLCRNTAFYRLGCNMNDDAALTAFNAMRD